MLLKLPLNIRMELVRRARQRGRAWVEAKVTLLDAGWTPADADTMLSLCLKVRDVKRIQLEAPERRAV